MADDKPQRRFAAKQRQCDVCGQSYEYFNGKSKYCSKRCADTNNRRTRPEAHKARRRADYHKHKEKRQAASKEWRARNAVYVAEQRKQYYHDNLDYHRALERTRDRDVKNARNRRYKENHREELAARQRHYHLLNPEVAALARAKRQALCNSQIDKLGYGEWAEIKRRYDYRCAYCGTRPETITMDHVVPLSKGGPHASCNIVPACTFCNSRKHDKWLLPLPPENWSEIEAALKESA